MAKPVNKFPANMQPNMVWAADPEVVQDSVDLHTYAYEDENGMVTSVSVWELDEEERKRVAETGLVYLYVTGDHPYAFLTGTEPELIDIPAGLEGIGDA